MSTDPTELDWGPFTADGYRQEDRTVAHVVAADLSSVEHVDAVLAWTIGRIHWSRRQLPSGTQHFVWFDVRGQQVPALVRDELRRALDGLARIEFRSR